MSKNRNPKILLEKIVKYEPKYFHFAGLGNQNVAKTPSATPKHFLQQKCCMLVTMLHFFLMELNETICSKNELLFQKIPTRKMS